MISPTESANLHALRAFVPYVPRAPRALVPYVPRALRALVHYVPCALHALVPHVSRTLRGPVFHVPCALGASCSMWPRALCFVSPFSLPTLLFRTFVCYL